MAWHWHAVDREALGLEGLALLLGGWAHSAHKQGLAAGARSNTRRSRSSALINITRFLLYFCSIADCMFDAWYMVVGCTSLAYSSFMSFRGLTARGHADPSHLRGWGQGRRVMTYIVEVGTELCSETMLEKCTIG